MCLKISLKHGISADIPVRIFFAKKKLHHRVTKPTSSDADFDADHRGTNILKMVYVVIYQFRMCSLIYNIILLFVDLREVKYGSFDPKMALF